jgi:hypothetical protein
VLLDPRHRLPGGLPSTFFVLMVGAPGPLTPPPKGPTIDFFVLIVGALEPPASPPRGATVDVFCIEGGRSWSSGTAS